MYKITELHFEYTNPQRYTYTIAAIQFALPEGEVSPIIFYVTAEGESSGEWVKPSQIKYGHEGLKDELCAIEQFVNYGIKLFKSRLIEGEI